MRALFFGAILWTLFVVFVPEIFARIPAPEIFEPEYNDTTLWANAYGQ